MEYEELTQTIIGCAMRVHNVLGPGYLESVYHRALIHELTKLGLTFESEKLLRVIYDGIIVGDFSADLLVEGRILPRTKSKPITRGRQRGPASKLPHRDRHRHRTPSQFRRHPPRIKAQDPPPQSTELRQDKKTGCGPFRPSCLISRKSRPKFPHRKFRD